MCAQRGTDSEFEMWAEREALAAATDTLYDVGTRTLLVARRDIQYIQQFLRFYVVR